MIRLRFHRMRPAAARQLDRLLLRKMRIILVEWFAAYGRGPRGGLLRRPK